MKQNNILLIGSGNMGSAFLEALMKSSLAPSSRIFVVDRSSAKLRKLKRRFHVRIFVNINKVNLGNIGIIIIAVKPQDAQNVLRQLKGALSPKTLLISIMAGIKITSLRRWAGLNHVIRVMPNLPISVGVGFSAWFAAPPVTKYERTFVRKLLQAGGQEYEASSEKNIDMITAVTGSGPAYVFSFVNDLVQAARHLGFSKYDAELMVIETLRGSLHLIDKSPEDTETLLSMVTSKGGVTEAALNVLKQSRVSKAWTKAVQAAAGRAESLATQLDTQFSKR